MKSIFNIPLFVALLAILTLCSGVGCGGGRSAPEAVRGVLDLADWDFARDGSVPLDGEWEFTWKYDPKRPLDRLQGSTCYIRMPGSWNDFIINGKKIGGLGYAEYRLRVILPAGERRMAFSMPDIDTAYDLFVDDLRVCGAGEYGTTKAASRPEWLPKVC